MTRDARAFTIVELLVVVAIIALLVGILLPAIGSARDQARVNQSQTNLRQMGTAHGTYAAEWNNRQFTLIEDNISRYGHEANTAFAAYHAMNGGCGNFGRDGGCHPPILLGWADDYQSPVADGVWGFWMHQGGNWHLTEPINFREPLMHFGSFRIPNARQFSRYLNGRFYDPIFYAPKDRVLWRRVEPCLENPGEFCFEGFTTVYWSSYCLSPSAMFNPDVMRGDADGGWQNPWDLHAGFRSPAMDQARYPDLKSHVLEHHWLQRARADCNPAIEDGTYEGCEPYYFNHGFESVPVTLFYDGHVEGLGVREATAADARVATQNGEGLWHRGTLFGTDGYLIDHGYDFSATSFHILTVDGIKGRDTLAQ